MEKNFKMLREPIEVGSIQLKNRMVMSPMWSRLATVNGEVSQQIIDYYAARARGGAAMILIESTAVDGRHLWHEPQLRLDDTKYMPGFHRLIEAIHLNGVPAIIELHQVGAYGTDPVSPSGVPCMTLGGEGVIEPRILNIKEIEETREAYVAAAVRAKEVGAEGVLVHGCTSYLLMQFFSPYFNKRTDRYGGSLENRMRLPLEIVRGIRQKCGPEFVVGYAFVVEDMMPGGITMKESIPFAQALEQEGVDYIDTTIGTYETLAVSEETRGSHKYQRTGAWDFSEKFKKVVTKAKIFQRTFGDYNPANWEEALEKGQTDVIQIARALLCDPELPNKALQGRVEDIRTCTVCTYCLETGTIKSFQVSCALNPDLGRERDYALKFVSKPRRVLIAGGGPGGLEAARVAALRGHEVTLVEKDAQLGGSLKVNSLCVGNEGYEDFSQWLVTQGTKAGVNFELNKAVTPELISAMKPDVVIVAIGANSSPMPPIPGAEKIPSVSVVEALRGKAPIGKHVVVYGGNRIGVDTAHTMAVRGLAENITIVEPMPVPMLAPDMETIGSVFMLMTQLPKYGVQGFTGTQLKEIKRNKVVFVDTEGNSQKIKADTIINALSPTPRTTLYEMLRNHIEDIYAVGDCVKARSVADAVHEAAYVARQI